MVRYFVRMRIQERVAFALLVVAVLLYASGIIWNFATWPSTVLLIIALVINSIGIHRDLYINRNPGGSMGEYRSARNAQENDPNKR